VVHFKVNYTLTPHKNETKTKRARLDLLAEDIERS